MTFHVNPFSTKNNLGEWTFLDKFGHLSTKTNWLSDKIVVSTKCHGSISRLDMRQKAW